MGSLIGGVLGGGANIVTSILGGAKSQDEMNQAQGALQAALAKIGNIQDPNLQQQIVLQQFQQQGILTPELEKSINDTFVQIQQNPAQQQGLQAQQAALTQLGQRAQGGLSAQDMANLAQIQQQAEGNANQAQQAIIQNAQQRGIAGGGSELAAQLAAAQGGANQERMAGLQVGANANQAALAALSQQGQLGGQIEGQQYQQAAQQQAAQQAIQNFNVQNQQAVQQRNVLAQNQAQAANLAAAQQLANANVAQANQEKIREVNAQQQQFQNALAQAQAQAGVYGAQAGQYNAQAKQIGQEYSNIGQGAGQIFGAIGGSGTVTPTPNTAGSQTGNGSSGGGFSNDQVSQLYDPNYASTAINPGAAASGPNLFWQGGMISKLAKGGMIKGYDEGGVYEPSLGAKILNPSSLDVTPSQPKPVQDSSGAQSGLNIGQLAALEPLLAAVGGKVPGKAKVPGDSPKNDTVNAKLSPGEIVVPRSIAHDPKAAAKFVEEENKKDLHGRLSALEKLCYGGMMGKE